MWLPQASSGWGLDLEWPLDGGDAGSPLRGIPRGHSWPSLPFVDVFPVPGMCEVLTRISNLYNNPLEARKPRIRSKGLAQDHTAGKLQNEELNPRLSICLRCPLCPPALPPPNLERWCRPSRACRACRQTHHTHWKGTEHPSMNKWQNAILQHATVTCYSQPNASTLIPTSGQLLRKCDDSGRVGLQCNLVPVKTGGKEKPTESCKQDDRRTLGTLSENRLCTYWCALPNDPFSPICPRPIIPITSRWDGRSCPSVPLLQLQLLRY